jgi:hypothetical protein
MRGGEIAGSDESLQVGFFKTNPLPKPMLKFHEQRILRSLAHQGGPPHWETHQLSIPMRLGNLLLNGLVYPWLHWRRKLAGQPPYVRPPNWLIRARVILRDQNDEVLWLRDQKSGVWKLPGAHAPAQQPPWQTAAYAIREKLGISDEVRDLRGIYPAANKAQMTFAFSGHFSGSPTKTESACFLPGKEPQEVLAEDAAMVADAQNEEISCRLIP